MSSVSQIYYSSIVLMMIFMNPCTVEELDCGVITPSEKFDAQKIMAGGLLINLYFPVIISRNLWNLNLTGIGPSSTGL